MSFRKSSFSASLSHFQSSSSSGFDLATNWASSAPPESALLMRSASRDGVGKLPPPPPLLEDWADTQHGIYCPVLVVPLPQLAEIDILSVQWNL